MKAPAMPKIAVPKIDFAAIANEFKTLDPKDPGLWPLFPRVVVLVALRKSVQELTRLLHSSYGDISAAAHAVRNVAEDVRGITQSVKTDVGAVSETIRHVNRGVRRAVRRAEGGALAALLDAHTTYAAACGAAAETLRRLWQAQQELDTL